MNLKTNFEKLPFKDRLASLTTQEQEFISHVQKGRKDPVYFSEHLLGLKLHEGQQLWLYMTTNTRHDLSGPLGIKLGFWKDIAEFNAILAKNPDFSRNILVPSNRWGKTFVTTVKHLWYCYYKIGTRGSPSQKADIRCGTLNLSPHSKQCDAGYQYVLDILSSKHVFTIDGVSYKNECKISNFLKSPSQQKREIFFTNGTSYRAVPTGEDQASSLAGTPYLYISYDECAQSLHLMEELPAKVMSRLIDFGGPLDLVSTPEVDRPSHQYFFHIAKLGKKVEGGWWTMIGKIMDNTFLGRDETERTLKSIQETDPAKYRQVAFGEFITTGKKMFDAILIERLWDAHQPPPILHQHKYLVSADWGFADNGDPTVFYVIDYTDWPRYRIVFVESIKGGNPFAVLVQAKMLQREWNNADFIHDASAMGGVVIKKILKEIEMTNVYDYSSGGGAQKTDMLFNLILVMSDGRKTKLEDDGVVTELNPNFGRLRSFHIPALESELGNYAYNPDKGVTDKKLEQDHVMALGQGLWYLEKVKHRHAVKQRSFNPLAPTSDLIFSKVMQGNGAKQVPFKVITIEEKRMF